jgi:uncharacterized protein YciI
VQQRYARLAITYNNIKMLPISATKKEDLVIIPDRPDSRQNRLALRPEYFENLKKHIEAGEVNVGGGMMSGHSGEDYNIGSVLALLAESEEAVRQWVMRDVFVKGAVWDVERDADYSLSVRSENGAMRGYRCLSRRKAALWCFPTA